MHVINQLRNRALGFGFKKDAKIIDLKIDALKCEKIENLGENSIMSTAFRTSSHEDDDIGLVVGFDSGEICIQFLDARCNIKRQCRQIFRDDCIYDVAWSLDGKHFYTACGDGSLDYCTLTSDSFIQCTAMRFSEVSQKCVVVDPADPNIIASGSAEGSIFLWDIRTAKKPELTIKQAHCMDLKHKLKDKKKHVNRQKQLCPIRSLVFQDENHLISSCATSPYIKVWDRRRSYCTGSASPIPVCFMEAPCPITGFSSLALDSSLQRLYARAQNASIQIFDVASYKKEPVGFMNSSSDYYLSFHVKIKLSPDKRHLAAGSSAGFLNIWNVKTNKLVYDKDRNVEQNKELLGIDWIVTRDHKNLICGGMDGGDLCFWRESFQSDLSVLEDPPSLNCKFNELQISHKNKRSKTPPPLHSACDIYESPTLNLPSFVENSSSHPVTKTSSAQKQPKTPTDWLTNLRREITPKRNAMTNSTEKNKSEKKSRRRLHPSSPGMSLPEFIQHHCKIPRMDAES